MKKYNRMTKREATEYFGSNAAIQRALEEHGKKVSRQYIGQWGGMDSPIPFKMQTLLVEIINEKRLRKRFKVDV